MVPQHHLLNSPMHPPRAVARQATVNVVVCWHTTIPHVWCMVSVIIPVTNVTVELSSVTDDVLNNTQSDDMVGAYHVTYM